MADYIKRTDVMKICEGYSEHCFNSSDAKGQDIADRILDDIVEIPTADVVEVKHGEWEQEGDDIFCSECGKGWNMIDNCTETFDYCPKCGAKMDGKQ